MPSGISNIAKCAAMIAICTGFALTNLGAFADTHLEAIEFGVKANGMTDDGPAIQRLIAIARSSPGRVVVSFPHDKTLRITTAPQGYVFSLEGFRDLMIDGRGSTFILAPDIRFLRSKDCKHLTCKRMQIDYSPSPSVDGVVRTVDPSRKVITINLDPTAVQSVLRPFQPRMKGQQEYFGMVWSQGAHDMLGHHLWIHSIEAGTTEGTVVAVASERQAHLKETISEQSQVSLPLSGIAHLVGAGACFDVADNHTVKFEDIELWSAPWFGFTVTRNIGAVEFHRVNIRPRPGSGRRTSAWRDGFHVKGNSATLLWSDCIIEGTNDDAFNISTHCSQVTEIVSPTTITVKQLYPLEFMPWREGATISAADPGSCLLLGQSRIVSVETKPSQSTIGGKPTAEDVTLQLDPPIASLKPGATVWQPETANPRTTLRRCTIRNSCRLQSPVTLVNCDITGFVWFHAEEIEGPFPSNVVIRNCTLKQGRGNDHLALRIDGRVDGNHGLSAVHNFDIENNEILGQVSISGVDSLQWSNNTLNGSATDNRYP